MQEDFFFDEVPQPKPRNRSTSSIPWVVAGALLVLAGSWYFGRTPKPLLSPFRSQDLSLHGVHLGQSYADLVKLRGKPALDQTGPDGARILSFVPGGISEMYVLVGDHVVDMETRGGASVQFPAAEVKVGESLENLEKLLGPSGGANSPGLSQTVWLCQDCRFAAQLRNGKAVSLKVFKDLAGSH